MLSRRVILPAVLATSLHPGVSGERIVYHDGTEASGGILRIDEEAVQIIAGEKETRIALHEIGAIQFRPGASDSPRRSIADVSGPVVLFRSGQLLAGEVTEAGSSAASAGAAGGSDVARVETAGAGTLEVPLELLGGFRLGRPHGSDELFRSDLAAAMGEASATRRPGAAPEDRVYVLRGRQLLKIGGVFRSLDASSLSMDYQGKIRRIPRASVFGVILVPVATRHVEGGYPAVFRLTSGDELPAMLLGMQQSEAGDRVLLLRFRGSPPEARQSLPLDRVQEVRFFSDRVLFLSDLAPVRSRESALVGSTTAFPWRRDRSTTGETLKLAGKTYRKGLGVHAYSSLEFDIGGRYSAFAATIGLVDLERDSAAAAPVDAGVTAGVTFRIVADGKALLEKAMTAAAKPESILLPVPGIERLRLEVDYGEDGFDFGDHAAWAEARVIRE